MSSRGWRPVDEGHNGGVSGGGGEGGGGGRAGVSEKSERSDARVDARGLSISSRN